MTENDFDCGSCELYHLCEVSTAWGKFTTLLASCRTHDVQDITKIRALLAKSCKKYNGDD